MNARDKSYDESLDAALLDPVEAAAYLEAVIEMDDPATLLLALRQVAKAHGMAEVARRAELGEKTLFALSLPSRSPSSFSERHRAHGERVPSHRHDARVRRGCSRRP